MTLTRFDIEPACSWRHTFENRVPFCLKQKLPPNSLWRALSSTIQDSVRVTVRVSSVRARRSTDKETSRGAKIASQSQSRQATQHTTQGGRCVHVSIEICSFQRIKEEIASLRSLGCYRLVNARRSNTSCRIKLPRTLQPATFLSLSRIGCPTTTSMINKAKK
jgi:hypothetical protein